jgi:hypothetical protein
MVVFIRTIITHPRAKNKKFAHAPVQSLGTGYVLVMKGGTLDLVRIISDLASVESAAALFVVGVVAAWFRPVTWHEKVEAWQFLHSIAPKAPPVYVDPLAWEDPDGLLPFPME